jgi:hypothetical protein
MSTAQASPSLSEFQRRLLPLMAPFQYAKSADDIAAKAGYRPARSGRLAVTSALRPLLREDNSGLVFRVPPRDRWDHARWGLTSAGKALAAQLQASDSSRSS